MKITNTKLPGVLIIEPAVFTDERGFFKELFQAERYKNLGVLPEFVQDNYSRSQKGVLRGLHFQLKKPQGKLVSCLSGAIFDVVVDIEPMSETFGQHIALELTAGNHKQLWVPPGYAHGFCVLSAVAEFHYKCTDYYDPNEESGLIWNDATVAIPWPVENPRVSGKDAILPSLLELKGLSK
jgi:dTDP-4-dehydrorhamnose 3,5-epimerase